MPNDPTNLTVKEREIQAALEAWNKYLPNQDEVIFFGGDELKVSTVAALLSQELGRHTRARQLENEHHRAVTERNSHQKEDRQLHLKLESFVRTRLAKEEGAMEAFDLVVVEPKRPSAATMSIAVDSRNRTRLKRHTMGSRQREAITTTPEPTLVVLGPDGKPLGPAQPSTPTSDPDPGSES